MIPSPPIVYTGPSLPAAEARRLLPGCEPRPPIARGDLYRDRESGAGLLIVLDGVLFQEPAVPPREILDVMADGALVVGASSMGALRAAECWPAGMVGLGSIYRLFRRGCLGSDDEVVLLFSADSGCRPLSVPLIEIRHALSKAVRAGRLARGGAESLASLAQGLHFAERNWPDLLDLGGVADPGGRLARWLGGFHLKRDDAVRALRLVARWLAADPGLGGRERRGDSPFVPSEQSRERAEDPAAGADPAGLRLALAEWHLLSGRYLRHLGAVAAALPGAGLGPRIERFVALDALLAGRGDGMAEEERLLRGRLEALRSVQLGLWRSLGREHLGGFAAALWEELDLCGLRDAELFRLRAQREAQVEAARLGLAARPRDRFLAESEIAHAHGFATWRELARAAPSAPFDWARFEAHRDGLALAKCLRERLFNPWS